MPRPLLHAAWLLRLVVLVLVVGSAIVALVMTYATVEVDPGGIGVSIGCGSPAHPQPSDFPALGDACASKLDHARDRRAGLVALGLGLAVPLLLLYERVARHPEDIRAAEPPDRTLVVQTERLLIRPAVPDDLAAFVTTIDAEVLETNGWRPAEHASYLAIVGGLTEMTLPVIIERESGAVIGSISLTPRPDMSAPTLGWWIGPAHRRQGYAREAVSGTLSALHAQGVRSVGFGTSVDNAAIIAIARDVGATEVRRGPHALPDGSTIDSIWYVHTG